VKQVGIEVGDLNVCGATQQIGNLLLLLWVLDFFDQLMDGGQLALQLASQLRRERPTPART
jgi:hypothetical protein